MAFRASCSISGEYDFKILHLFVESTNQHLGVSKNSGKTHKMDGENNAKPYEQMDDLGGKPPLFLVQHPPEKN